MPPLSYSPFEKPTERFNDFAINPYVKASESDPLVIMGKDLISKKDNWRKELNRDEVILEVGCHTGHTLTKIAKDHPSKGFIGIDRTFKRVVSTSKKLQSESLENTKVCLVDGVYLEEIFGHEELDGIICFFPDPWPKKKHLKNRLLVKEAFIAAINNTVKRDGFFWLKTDSESYFLEFTNLLLKTAFIRKEGMPFESDYSSIFEKKFQNSHCNIYEAYFMKSGIV